jgi:hypothetical protein
MAKAEASVEELVGMIERGERGERSAKVSESNFSGLLDRLLAKWLP